MKASREKVDAFLSTIKDIPIELIEDAARLYATSTKRTGEYDSFEAFFRGANPDPLFAAEVVAGTRDYSQAELLYIFGAVHGTAFRTWFDGSKEMKRDLSPSFRQNNYVLASEKRMPTKVNTIAFGAIEDMRPLDGAWLNRGDKKRR